MRSKNVKVMLRQIKFKYLVNSHKNRLYGYALYMMKNRMDAEDVTQEVLVKLWENMDGIKQESVKSWLLSAAHNLCVDKLRKRNSVSRNETYYPDNFEEFSENAIAEEDPYRDISDPLLTGRIEKKINKLPANLRSVFLLYETQGLKYREIAEALKIPVNSVKVYLMRARKKLQEDLKEYVTD